MVGTGGQSGAGSAAPDELVERLTEGARRISDSNWVDTSKGGFHLPSPKSYRSFFAWDSGWNVLGLGMARPDRALTELETIFALQHDNGAVPHEVRIPEVRAGENPLRTLGRWLIRAQFDDEGRSRFIDPPSYLLAAETLWRRTEDPRVLALIPQMRRTLDHLTGAHDLNGDGLAAIVHPWEAGTDAAPVFDQALGLHRKYGRISHEFAFWRLVRRLGRHGWDLPAIADDDRFVVEDLAINGLTAAGAVAVASLCDAAGDATGAAACRAQAAGLVEAIEAHLWDEERDFYLTRSGHHTQRLSPRTCATGLAPLLSGLVAPERAGRAIDKYLTSADHFAAPWPVAFNSRSEIAGERVPFRRQPLWRGPCVWISVNWIAANAAARYDRPDAARHITTRTAELIDQRGYHEYYDPETGDTAGAESFTWSALVLDMIATHGL